MWMSQTNKKTVLVNSAVYLPGEGGYKRTMYLFDMMLRMGREVVLLTSDFNHYAKQARDIEAFRAEYPEYNDSIAFEHVPTYKKNISVLRYWSELVWAQKVKRWVAAHSDEIDVIMMDMPDMNAILGIRKICKAHHIKMLIDVRDLWPEAFHVLIRNDRLYKILTWPLKLRANKAYRCADEFVAVSQEYLDRGLQANQNVKDPGVIYLGATLEKFYDGVEKFSHKFPKPSREIWITYAGTLGESYDLTTLIDAARIVEQERGQHIRFKILGQGPDEEKLRKHVDSVQAHNVDFVGFLPYEEMAAFLCASDVTVNAVKKNASQSIINKVADYLAAGIPMLNSCTCQEQQDMVDRYGIGLNYEAENAHSLVSCIYTLVDDSERCAHMGENARKLAEEKFDRRVSYLEILKRLDALGAKE
jgi:glycosyltransferase involved in cell wall biosynthesis